MFALNIALGNTAWRLLFKDEEKAQAAFAAAESARLMKASCDRISDDFGQTFSGGDGIAGVMFEDMNKTKMAHVEIALHNARTQALVTKTAQADPGLRASSMMNGPSMLDPMGSIMRGN